MTGLVEMQQHCLLGEELVGRKRSRTSTCYTPAKRHGALLATSLANQDTPPIIVPFQLMPLRYSFLETENMTHCEYTRLVSNKVSERWRTPTAHQSMFLVDFTAAKSAAAFQNTKPGRDPLPNSICPELIIHSGDTLKPWFRGFLSSCLRHPRISKVWRRALVVTIPKLSKPKKAKELSYDIFNFCPLLRSSKGLSMPVLNP